MEKTPTHTSLTDRRTPADHQQPLRVARAFALFLVNSVSMVAEVSTPEADALVRYAESLGKTGEAVTL